MAPTGPDLDRIEPRRPGAGALVAAVIATGTLANLAAVGALALLARGEGRAAIQPVNATSHWIHGPGAGSARGTDLARTGVGYATNHAAALFWALPFTLWLFRRPDRTAFETVGGAAVTTAAAGLLDYGILPRRLAPGWEHAVSPRSVAVGFAALGAGLAAGGLLARAVIARR